MAHGFLHPFSEASVQSSQGCWVGLTEGAIAWCLAALHRKEEEPLLVVVPSTQYARLLQQELAFYLGAEAPTILYQGDDVRPYDGLSPHPQIPRNRIAAFEAMDRGAPCIILATARSLLHRVPLIEHQRNLRIHLHEGMRLNPRELTETLLMRGYLSTQAVEEPGTFRARAGVFDLWPSTAQRPLRIEMFDDEVDEIRTMDPVTLRSQSRVSSCWILPSREALTDSNALERAAVAMNTWVEARGEGLTTLRRILREWDHGVWFSGAETYLPALQELADPLSQVPSSTRIVVVEPTQVREELLGFEQLVQSLWKRTSPDKGGLVPPDSRYNPASGVVDSLSNALSLSRSGTGLDFDSLPNKSLFIGSGDLAPVANTIHGWLTDDWSVNLVVSSRARAERLQALLQTHGLTPREQPAGQQAEPGRLVLWIGDLPRGFHSPLSRIAVLVDRELFGQRTNRRSKPRLEQTLVQSFSELKQGDLIVHSIHGIGRFDKLTHLSIGGPPQDYVLVEYRGGDRLYLPVHRLQQLCHYRAMGSVQPRLDKLGGTTWLQRKQRVRDRILSMAHEILRLHAVRESQDGTAYPGKPTRYLQFEQTFPYLETPDQEGAIEEVLGDLAQPRPMDRLLVGDVGFGKTEVALRAAVRIVLGGAQVAFLCPTTVLAYQHLQTMRQRLDGFALRIELLSRFRTSPEIREVLAATRRGEVDILVGTSSLLGKSVSFENLGLVIVDEEHRFGVRQKQKLKRMSTHVHYLAMSATPIPRTLHMALTGLRSVSLITTPPEGRRGIRTQLIRMDPQAIREEIIFELQRGGQVFFVHHRVQTIDTIAQMLRDLVPEATFVVAHGQLSDQELERALLQFIQREAHVLVCTTIIESGVDLPNVNTILINRADTFGLSQLYQLRGRVGRSSALARCTLLLPADGEVKSTSMRRLQALQAHSDLGSGFAVASADLELRGSGNLLGERQHGHIQAVGLDTYVELLQECVRSVQGTLEREALEPELEIPVPAFIPETFISDLDLRLVEYRRLASARTPADARSLLDSWEERFGDPPREVLNLGWQAEARLRCRELGIRHVSWLKERVELRLVDSSPIEDSALLAITTDYPKRFSLPDSPHGKTVQARFTPQEGEWPFRFLHWVFEMLQPPRPEGKGDR
ncbi:MAG: transcription-repair coupling factor [Myxococcota bacterium]|nr:transcription-repair coupling factor [Myxococcota bacterium]